ncbi:hypothetical protein [Celeribacter marinus]|uniref:hypothetical protein n=1 Tax=Celeribacter marinus TaxID=1397108 RepID=UPI003F6BD4BB
MDPHQIRITPDIGPRHALAARPLGLSPPLPTKQHTLAAWLRHDFALARTWDDLHAALMARGYALDLGRKSLILQTLSGQKLWSVDDLGQSYASLTHRFGAALPQNSQLTPIAEQIESTPRIL